MRFVHQGSTSNGLDQEDSTMKAKLFRMAVTMSLLAVTVESLGAAAKWY